MSHHCTTNYVHPSGLSFKVEAIDWPNQLSARNVVSAAIIWLGSLDKAGAERAHEQALAGRLHAGTNDQLSAAVHFAQVLFADPGECFCRLRVHDGFTNWIDGDRRT